MPWQAQQPMGYPKEVAPPLLWPVTPLQASPGEQQQDSQLPTSSLPITQSIEQPNLNSYEPGYLLKRGPE